MFYENNKEIEANNIQKQEIGLLISNREEDFQYCRHFYYQFRTHFSISALVMLGDHNGCNWLHEWAEKEGLGCKTLDEKEIRNLYLIVCCPDRRKTFDDVLYNRGFFYGQDYTDYLYVVQSFRHKFSLDLKEKKIWIFGEGEQGVRFYEEYKSIYPIQGFLSDSIQQTECSSVPVVDVTELPADRKDVYVVICSDNGDYIAHQLLNRGMRGYEQFCFQDILPKKLFVAVGTCQIRHTVATLCRNPEFVKRYDSFNCYDSSYKSISLVDYLRFEEYGEFCDVVFYHRGNIATQEYKNYDTLVVKKYKKAKRITIPFYYFTGQIQQADGKPNPYFVNGREQYGSYLWIRGDAELNRMIEEGMEEDDIVVRVSSEDYWSQEEIRRRFQRELKRIDILDRFSSLPIRDYIEKNYRTELVFMDGTHFNHRLMAYLANEIAKQLDIIPATEAMLCNPRQRDIQMAVYPCVKTALGMQIPDESGFCNVVPRKFLKIPFEEYVRKYIRYVKCILEIYGKTGTELGTEEEFD